MMPYIDFNEIETPVKYTFVDKYYSYINTNLYSHYDIFLQKNEYALFDSYFTSNSKSDSFYSISHEKISYGPYYDGWIGDTRFYLDNSIHYYERKVYNLYDMISDIGGINQVVITFCMVIMNIYTNRIYDFFTAQEFFNFKLNKSEQSRDEKVARLNSSPKSFKNLQKQSIANISCSKVANSP